MQRIKAGGHNIPEPVVLRRQFKMGSSNLEMMYKPLGIKYRFRQLKISISAL